MARRPGQDRPLSEIETSISQAIEDRSQHLPIDPIVAKCCVALLSENSSIPASLVLRDPGMTALLLQISHGPLAGDEPAECVADALAGIDRRVLRASLIHHLLQCRACRRTEDLDRSWNRSLRACSLAEQFPGECPERARVAGLLLDLGRYLIIRWVGSEHGEWTRESRKSGRPVREIEREKLGFDAVEVTARLFEAWRFSKAATHAIRSLAERSPVQDWTTLTRILNVSEQCSEAGSTEELARLLDAVELPVQIAESAEASYQQLRSDRLAGIVREPVRWSSLQARVRELNKQQSLEQIDSLVERENELEKHRTLAEELRRERDSLRELICQDPLLGIGNRRHFDNRLVEEWKRCQRNGQPLSLILFDIDRFKNLNDTYRHQAGDAVLRAVTQTLRGLLRSTDVFARYGGEEFAVVCPETDAAGAVALAERMRQEVERLVVRHHEDSLVTTASFGVATVEDPLMISAVDQIIAIADDHLYRAKRSGRNRVEYGNCPGSVVFSGSSHGGDHRDRHSLPLGPSGESIASDL